MSLQLLVAAFLLHRSITPCFRIVQDHGLAKNVEAIGFFNRAGRGVHAIKDDEGLALGLEILLCDDF